MRNKLLTVFLALILACTLSCSSTWQNIFGETWEEQTATGLTMAISTVRTACMLQYIEPDICVKAEKAYETAWQILEAAIKINAAVESEDRLQILTALSDLQTLAVSVEELVEAFRSSGLTPEQFEHYLITVGVDPDIVVAGIFD